MCCHVVNILLNIVKCKMNQRILFDYWCECGVWRENKRLACVIRQLGMKRWRIVYPCTGRSSFKTNFFNEIRWPLLVINISFSTLTKLTKKTFFFFFFFFFEETKAFYCYKSFSRSVPYPLWFTSLY